MLKFNKSQDGKLRATVKISFRIDLGYINCAVYTLLEEHKLHNNPPPKITRGDVEEKMREQLQFSNIREGFWDHIPREEIVEAELKALKLFPELEDQATWSVK